MLMRPVICFIVGLVCSAMSSDTLHADEHAAEQLLAGKQMLAGKGLIPRGAYYLLPAEQELGKGLKQVRKTSLNLQKQIKAQRAFEARRAAYKREMLGYVAQRRRLNQQLSGVTDEFENNRLVARINDLSDRITLIQEGLINSGHGAALYAALGQARRQYLQELAALQELAERTQGIYSALSGDELITQALAEVNKHSKRQYALGPRRSFAGTVAQIEELASAVVSESITLREESNVFLIDVILNEQFTKSMVLDTGASFVSLPSQMAAEIGLVPSVDDLTLNLQLADGRVVQARGTTLTSIQVGALTIPDVPCVVMPPEVGDAPPLLGGTFLRHFVYAIDPHAKKLSLTRIEQLEK